MRIPPRTMDSIAKSNVNFKLKPPIFPSDMVILVDSREQSPLFGPRLPKGMTLCVEKLDCADYTIRGFSDKICVERKGMSDLLSFVTIERDKTIIKMQKMAKMEWAALVVEAKDNELYRPYLYSKVSPELVRQCLVSFSIRYGIHVFNGDRERCQRYVADHFIKYWSVKHSL